MVIKHVSKSWDDRPSSKGIAKGHPQAVEHFGGGGVVLMFLVPGTQSFLKEPFC